MKESIGSTFMYNIIIIFIVTVFAFIAGTMSYFKAFKVNTQVVSAIEKYEGYNELAIDEIHEKLATMGYRQVPGITCPVREGAYLYDQDPNFTYCVHLFCDNKYEYSYGVTTYIYVDFPVINTFLKIPIYTRTNKIHNMTGWECGVDFQH